MGEEKPFPHPLSGFDDLAALDFHGDLGERRRGRARYYRAAVGRVEDRAVARAGELAALVGYRASLVRADRRVRHEVTAVQVDQNGGICFGTERDGATGRNLGRARDSRPARFGIAAGGFLFAAARLSTIVVVAAGLSAARTSATLVTARPGIAAGRRGGGL
jgi:hypothetical protein